MEADQNLRNRLTTGMLIALAFLFTCITLACAAGRWLPVSSLPEGFVVHICGGSAGIGKLRAGVWWLSPYVKDVPRWAFVSPSFPACTFIPWLPFLPQYGTVMLP